MTTKASPERAARRRASAKRATPPPPMTTTWWASCGTRCCTAFFRSSFCGLVAPCSAWPVWCAPFSSDTRCVFCCTASHRSVFRRPSRTRPLARAHTRRCGSVLPRSDSARCCRPIRRYSSTTTITVIITLIAIITVIITTVARATAAPPTLRLRRSPCWRRSRSSSSSCIRRGPRGSSSEK